MINDLSLGISLMTLTNFCTSFGSKLFCEIFIAYSDGVTFIASKKLSIAFIGRHSLMFKENIFGYCCINSGISL